jgi:ankyrin repeat protein
MSTSSPNGDTAPRLTLPERPNLRHLRQQARDLHRAGEAASLANAQFQLAQRYGFSSWPKLKSHVESLEEIGQLKAAIDANDLARVQAMMTKNPALHRAPLGYGKNGPLTWVAECRVPREPPSETRLAMARWMIENGSDIHQGGDGPLMRAALSDSRIPMMELLVAHGADVNALWNGDYPIVFAPCETLQPGALRWLLEQGADLNRISEKYGSPLAMVVGTYSRNATGKHACLEVFAEQGYDLPDTPTMALHRGRLDLLAEHQRRTPDLLSRHFTDAEIYPAEVGLKPGEGMHVTPIEGTTLLHLAIEFDDLETARWLLDHGADVNARAAVDADGFGGHTPLYHAVVTLGRRDDAKARLLLERGAIPNVRANIRKQLRDVGDPEKERLQEYRDVTPLAYARQFVVPEWVSEPALVAIAEYAGDK